MALSPDGTDELVVHVDGGARGNPGPAAIGVVVRASDGTVLDEFGETIGRATNNVAEYRALIAGVRRARRLGARRVSLLGDSQLVVRQVEGAWKVKDANLRALREEAWRELEGLESWQIAHVRREENAEADRLVNQALDAAAT